MSIVLSSEANRWCERMRITGNTKEDTAIKTKLDFHYLTALIGFAAQRCVPLSDSQGKQIIEHWTADFREYRDLMIGVLVSMDFYNKGLLVTENTKAMVKKELTDMIDVNNEMRMTRKGVNLLNAFANGGFEEIRDLWGNIAPPEEPIVFLKWYVQKCIPKYFPE